LAQAAGDRPAQPAQTIFSMGQPPRWQPYVSGFAADGGAATPSLGIAAGVYRPILNPVTGLLGVSLEGVAEHSSGHSAGDARVFAKMPSLGFSAGADWQVTSGKIDPIVSFEMAGRRAGLIGHGSQLRIDWLPSRERFALGLQIPLKQPFAGRTRARTTSVSLDDGRTRTDATHSPAMSALRENSERAILAVANAATAIRAYTNLYSDENERALTAASSSTRNAGGFDEVTRTYRQELAAAFAFAASESTVESSEEQTDLGARIAARARGGALTHVILPYDALFGQVKASATCLGALVGDAHEDFSRWLRDSSDISNSAQARVAAVHARWLGILDDECGRLSRQWKDTRLVWLPLQFALAPEEYDEQEKIDALIARAVGHRFTNQNALAYLRTSDLPLEIARSILAARRYHVLWTHDFTGRRPSGALDEISYTMVADAYLPALTAAVTRYDSTGTLPQYVILLDAFYYHARDGALWMNILENPLGAAVTLKAGEDAQATHLRQRLTDLRAAVEHSRRLTREAELNGGDAWLQRVVRVQVNVTLPSDFSFRSGHLVPPFPFTPDNIVRDHRKMVLYDYDETDPYDGEFLVTGIGVGEHYASATWEDRGYRVRGPAALEARAALRRLLQANGFRADQIPIPLRSADTSGTARTGRTVDHGYVGRAVQVHNEVGFGAKDASVARAMLYNLAPSGSVIVAPDPLWVSPTWAAMLAGAAARGCQVMIIAPALANAPSPEPPIIVLEHDVLERLLAIRHTFDRQFAAAGGALRIGVYASNTPVTDVSARLAEVHSGLSRSPWIQQLIPFDAQTLDTLDRALAGAARTDRAATAIATDDAPRAPQLHQKTIMVARRSAIAELVRQPGWAELLARTMREQARETARLVDAIKLPAPTVDTAAVREADAPLEAYERGVSPAERKQVGFYFAVGTQNHDPRGIMLDGESTVIVSGIQASAGLVDLFYLMARTTWIETGDELDRLVPRPRGLIARVARLIRFAM
jgi:phosphatidylserine/phosphatidylglycerophosphate/cardiolipin synthase-like enzyme